MRLRTLSLKFKKMLGSGLKYISLSWMTRRIGREESMGIVIGVHLLESFSSVMLVFPGQERRTWLEGLGLLARVVFETEDAELFAVKRPGAWPSYQDYDVEIKTGLSNLPEWELEVVSRNSNKSTFLIARSGTMDMRLQSYVARIFSHQIYAFSEKKNRSMEVNWAIHVQIDIFKTILLVVIVGSLAWFYKAIQPPPTGTVGSTGGASVTSPRIKLRDRRHLAYKEFGFPRDEAKFKIIYIHGFDSCMLNSPFPQFLSQALVEELRIYTVSFDRPGYGESDPDPNRSPRSIALDIEELADGLGLGPNFYVVGLSMGGEITWTCLMLGVFMAPKTNDVV
ncbi:hypothetical protein DY000_02006332 [Brassica cretica]|uniref:AB hydrolase-1 domain-containing protein n=1 Tax=Brassica cretica TaxID=69181 RepID=A0ABQ7BTF9_BRACR|nr:hypothetical protein DY000_02006332 [Brassica cretica]